MKNSQTGRAQRRRDTGDDVCCVDDGGGRVR